MRHSDEESRCGDARSAGGEDSDWTATQLAEDGAGGFMTASNAASNGSTHGHSPPRSMADAVRGTASAECRTCARISDGVHKYRQTAGEWHTQHQAEPALGLPPSARSCNCRPQQRIHTQSPAPDLSRTLVERGLGRLCGYAINVCEVWSRPNQSRLGLGSRPRHGTLSRPTDRGNNQRPQLHGSAPEAASRLPLRWPCGPAKGLALITCPRHDIEYNRAVQEVSQFWARVIREWLWDCCLGTG